MKGFRLATISVATALGFSVAAPALAGGFERPASLEFRLNAAGMGVYREQLRQSLNAQASSGSIAAQTQSNMSNVVQVTENYDIVLNGDGNTINSGGGYSGQQASTDSNQTTDNQINTNSSLATVRGSATVSGSNVSGGSAVLNP